MIYLWPQASSMIGMSERFGVMTSPAHGMVPLGVQEGRKWGYDNGCYSDSFHPKRFLRGLILLGQYRKSCLFVACPDIVGNAGDTMELYARWAYRIKRRGFPVAFVAQDGQEHLPFPIAFDWLFIGGTDQFKLGSAADECIRRAKRIGKPVHVGRVNSIKRMAHFKLMEVDSVDGTFPIYEPDTARARLSKGLAQPALFSVL